MALVFVQDHPGKLSCGKVEKDKKTKEMTCKGGFTPSIHIRTAKAPCQMTSINWKMGKSTSNQKVEGVPYIEGATRPRWSASRWAALPPWTPTRSLCSERSRRWCIPRSKKGRRRRRTRKGLNMGENMTLYLMNQPPI